MTQASRPVSAPPPPPPSARAASGPPSPEQAAQLRALVDAHLGFVWRSLRRFGLSAADADDASQRVFLIVKDRLERIEAGKEKAFLFAVANNVARDARRAAAQRPESVLEDFEVTDTQPGPEELTDRKRARAALDGILDSMPEEVRAVFVLNELEGMTREEIAEAVGAPAGTVASRLRRGRELFQAEAARLRARASFKGAE